MERKDSWCASFYCIREPGENQIWKSMSSELANWAASQNRATCWRRLLIKLLMKNCSGIFLHPSKTQKDLTMKQMFVISEKLITEQSDEIYGVNTINWEESSWKHFSLVGGEKVISLSHTKVYVFSDSVLCLNENPQNAWQDRLMWFKSSSEYRVLDTIDGESMEFKWNIFLGCTTLQLVREVQELLSKMSTQLEDFTGRIIFMSMFNDISWRSQDNNKECESSAQLVSLYAKRFSPWDGYSSDLEQKRNGVLLTNTNHKDNGTELRSKWW